MLTHTHTCMFNKTRYNNDNVSMVFSDGRSCVMHIADNRAEQVFCLPISHLHRIASLSRCRIRSARRACARVYRCTYAWAFMSVDGAPATILCLP